MNFSEFRSDDGYARPNRYEVIFIHLMVRKVVVCMEMLYNNEGQKGGGDV